jgi:DNA-binding transcriptional LysR family regulator
VDVSGNFETNNAVTLRHMALAGLGLIRVANFVVAADLRAGRLQEVLSDFEPPTDLTVYAVYPHGRHLSPKVRVFTDLLAETFLPAPPWQ